jgi:hypothetical protein
MATRGKKSRGTSSKGCKDGKRGRRWSQRVTKESDALDLEKSVFAGDDPKKMARSLKRSAESSRRRKSSPYRSAMSMITFYLNRAGTQLPASQRRTIDAAKDELRELYGKKATTPPSKRPARRKQKRTRKKKD